jgi:glycosyltransferase involved in cell wall biosynthesis
MRILLIHNFYANRGGEDEVVDYEKKLLIKSGFEIVEYFKNNNNIKGICYKIKILFNFFFSFGTFSEVDKIIKVKKPDLAHIHNIYPIISPSIYFVLKKYKIPIIHTIHNYRFFCSNGLCLKNGKICIKCEKNSIKNIFNICSKEKKEYDFLLKIIIYITRLFNLFKKVDFFIAPSDFVKNKLISSGINSDKVIIKRYTIEIPDRSSYLIKKDLLDYFIFVGRLSEEKGIIQLVDAFKLLDPIKLVILGEGPLKEELTIKLKNENIRNVQLMGFIKGKEKQQFISKSLALIISSIWFETGPLTALESLSLGVPIIVNNVVAIKENLIDSYNCFLYEADNADSLGNVIAKLVVMEENDYDKLKANSLVVFNELFNEEKNFEILVRLYKNQLGKNKVVE